MINHYHDDYDSDTYDDDNDDDHTNGDSEESQNAITSEAKLLNMCCEVTTTV